MISGDFFCLLSPLPPFSFTVTDCDSGSACENQDVTSENVTATYVDGVLYCCSTGNSITISVLRNTSGYSQAQSTSVLSSDSFDSIFVSSDVSLSGASNSSNNQVVCECRDVDLEDVTGYFDDIRKKFWDTFDSTWDKISGFLS